MNRRPIVILLLLFIVAACSLSSCSSIAKTTPPTSVYFTKERYDALKLGMTYEQVSTILGTPRQKADSLEFVALWTGKGRGRMLS